MKKDDKRLKNLIPFSQRTENEQRKITKNGGKKSGEVRRKKKAISDAVLDVLEMPVKSEKLKAQMSDLGIKTDKNTDMLTAAVAGLIGSACAGKVDAFKELREIKERAESSPAREEYPPVAIPATLICGAYADVNRHISEGKLREVIIKGGRGGWKSSYVGLKLPELLMANPSQHALCLRNVKDTLKDSVYEQIKWGIERLGVSDRFKCTTSPLKIVYKPTGQTIYFRGADDPIKLKSIKPPFGYIGVLWLEEFDQYAGEAAVRNVRQSAIRGTDENGESGAIVFETFNPPATAQAWVNGYVRDIEARADDPDLRKQGTEILHVDYTSVPREWLGDDFLREAEELKRNNPRAYENEYLGKVTGTGGNVFENLEIRAFTNEERASFDRIRQGLDWGYFPDPTAFVRVHYDATRSIVYVFDERKRVKTGNEELAELFAPFKREQTIADSAEEKSIAYFRSNGYNIRACVKGAGSVEFGLKWLASRRKIVIDKTHCAETAKEFESYEYLRDREGNFVSGYPDENNHFIDAVRYALNDEIMRSKAAVKKTRY
ncbi:MAG: PBSX family phage terminase large subunit [Clostridia bacterium]|nr:PBSX family phage terminase large subunit [Clostridia bacterium]